jgi:hypothetical protein
MPFTQLNTIAALTMEWTHHASYFLGGVFFANAVPHFVSGVMGRPFQSPFAKPPGRGLSSSKVNVLWGFSTWLSVMFLSTVLEILMRTARIM